MLVSTATGSLMVPASPLVLAKMVTPRRYRDPAYAAHDRRPPLRRRDAGRTPTWPPRAARAWHGSGRGAATLYQLLAGAGWTSLPFLPLLRQPTLMLAGDDDPIIPLVNARIMHRLLPNSTLHVYDDGHLGLVTKAPELGPVVERFLRT